MNEKKKPATEIKTTRSDYSDLSFLERLAPGEPVFVLRGQDKHAVAMLRRYEELLVADGGDPQLIGATRQLASQMAAWPTKKAPDLAPPVAQPGDDATAAALADAGVKKGDRIDIPGEGEFEVGEPVEAASASAAPTKKAKA